MPRTAAAERAAAASDHVSGAAMIGGVAGAVVVAAATQAADVGGSVTPGAERELAEAVALIRKAAVELGDHPAAAQLHHAVAQGERAPLARGAEGLASVVRRLHPELRTEFDLLETRPLTNWSVNDAEDEAAVVAAGLGRRSRVIKIAIVVFLVVGLYVFIFTR